jgi:hypothetical protein
VPLVWSALAEGPVGWVPSQGKTAEELWARSALHNPIADSRLALRTLNRSDLAELLFPDEQGEVIALQTEVDQQWAAYLGYDGPVLPGDLPPVD